MNKYLLIVIYRDRETVPSALELSNHVYRSGSDAVIECIHSSGTTQIYSIESSSFNPDLRVLRSLERSVGEDLESALWIKRDLEDSAYHLGSQLVEWSEPAGI